MEGFESSFKQVFLHRAKHGIPTSRLVISLPPPTPTCLAI